MILDIILIAVLGFIFESFAPWWTLALAAFMVASLRSKSSAQALKSGFFGGAGLWFLAGLLIHLRSGGILTGRIAEMLQLPWGGLILLLTAFIGGAAASLAALAGYQVTQWIKRQA